VHALRGRGRTLLRRRHVRHGLLLLREHVPSVRREWTGVLRQQHLYERYVHQRPEMRNVRREQRAVLRGRPVRVGSRVRRHELHRVRRHEGGLLRRQDVQLGAVVRRPEQLQLSQRSGGRPPESDDAAIAPSDGTCSGSVEQCSETRLDGGVRFDSTTTFSGAGWVATYQTTTTGQDGSLDTCIQTVTATLN
jgi:hypothetical protein